MLCCYFRGFFLTKMPMKTRSSILGCLTIAAFLSISSAAQAWSNSLYDPTHAVSVTNNPLINFGPQASHFRYDPRMIRAAEIAAERAHPHSTRECWRYVKNALVQAQVVGSRPGTAYAKEAGSELREKFGFKEIHVQNPYEAPIGAVLVYGGHGAGHVEIRTANGFVSDFESLVPSTRPLLGVFLKPS